MLFIYSKLIPLFETAIWYYYYSSSSINACSQRLWHWSKYMISVCSLILKDCKESDNLGFGNLCWLKPKDMLSVCGSGRRFRQELYASGGLHMLSRSSSIRKNAKPDLNPTLQWYGTLRAVRLYSGG